jgi:hypothetical protein
MDFLGRYKWLFLVAGLGLLGFLAYRKIQVSKGSETAAKEE